MFKIYLIIINIISLFLYYLDKRRAIKRRYRISEKVLIMFDVLGGCYGCLFGMYLFRHKTKHFKFIVLNFLLSVIWTYVILKKLQIL